MLAWLRPPVNIIERQDESRFEPAHAAYYSGPPRKYFRLLLQARADFLSVWRESDHREIVAAIRLLRRQVVFVNAPDAIRHVLGKRHENYARKTPQMRRALEFLLGDGLFISDGETWKQRRSLVSDIVHRNRVPGFGTIMEQTAGELVARWETLPPGTTLDILHEMGCLTAEIIARSVFGNRLGHDDADAVMAGFTRYQSLVDSVNPAYFLGFDDGLPVLRSPALRRSVRRIHRIVDKVVGDHLAGRGDHNSMVELLVRRQQRSPELGLDLVALRNEAATIFMAGHETTAATLAWAWYLLSRSPRVSAAVEDEIARVCGSRPPAVADIPRLEWCRAVVEETLRLYPPVPILGRQAREADRIGPVAVKPADLILIVPWTLHRTPSLFPDPHAFRPERFLGEARPAPYSYIPFAVGPRVCPGMHFGLTEAVICLATVAQRFRVRVPEGHKVEPVCRLTLRPRGGLPATVERR